MWGAFFKSIVWSILIAALFYGLPLLYFLILVAGSDVFFYKRLIPKKETKERCVTTIDGSSHRVNV